jgi:hypothetical protein
MRFKYFLKIVLGITILNLSKKTERKKTTQVDIKKFE